jgi:hypothetical protein
LPLAIQAQRRPIIQADRDRRGAAHEGAAATDAATLQATRLPPAVAHGAQGGVSTCLWGVESQVPRRSVSRSVLRLILLGFAPGSLGRLRRAGGAECDVDRQARKRRACSSAVDRGRIERQGAIDRSDELFLVKVQSAAIAQVGGTATTNAIAQGGGAGQAFVNPGQTAYAFSTALPDKACSATLIDGAHDVVSALWGPRDMVFGAAIEEANYAPVWPTRRAGEVAA